MSYARQMLDTYPHTLNADAGVLAAAIDALSDCATEEHAQPRDTTEAGRSPADQPGPQHRDRRR
jgi:hypothetical protein